MVSGDKNGVLATWDINKEKHINKINAHNGGIGKVEFVTSHDQYLIATGGLKDGSLSLFDLRTEK